MNIVICHGYAHRLVETGEVQSCPVASEAANGQGSILLDGGSWHNRAASEMDLSGGDEALVREMLERMGHIFVDGLTRLPHAEKLPEATVAEHRML